MFRISRFLLLMSLSLLVIACAGSPDKQDNMNEQPGATDLIICQEPRPAICTMEYNPVCGVLKDGSRKTGSTGCTSCSDPEVTGYTMGEC